MYIYGRVLLIKFYQKNKPTLPPFASAVVSRPPQLGRSFGLDLGARLDLGDVRDCDLALAIGATERCRRSVGRHHFHALVVALLADEVDFSAAGVRLAEVRCTMRTKLSAHPFSLSLSKPQRANPSSLLPAAGPSHRMSSSARSFASYSTVSRGHESSGRAWSIRSSAIISRILAPLLIFLPSFLFKIYQKIFF